MARRRRAALVIGVSETAARRKGRDRKRTVGVTAPQPAAGAAHQRSGDRLGPAPHGPSDWSNLSAEHSVGGLRCGPCTGCMRLASSQTAGLKQRSADTVHGPVHPVGHCSAGSRTCGRTAVLSYVDGCAAYLSSPDWVPAFTREAVSPSRDHWASVSIRAANYHRPGRDLGAAGRRPATCFRTGSGRRRSGPG
jgi:hypothetical protein